MENKKILSKGKLLIALMATLLIVAVVGLLSPKLSMQAYASSVDELLDDAISASIMQNDIIDVMMSDGNLGWDPTIYAAEQAQHEATAEEFLSNSAQTYSTTMSSSTAPHGALRTMHPATQTTNQIVIYIIADRYTDTQQETFFTAAQNIANHIVGAHPVSEYKAWVQIYAMGTCDPTIPNFNPCKRSEYW